jgi:hypothetical protein
MRFYRMRAKMQLTLVAQPQDFFRELVTAALSKQKVSIQPETEFYLVNLLNQFMHADRLYTRSVNGEPEERPLAILVKEALEHNRAHERVSLFRHIGDVSLYKAGYFQESLNRKLVDIDYYIKMGGAAYSQVAYNAEENHLRSLYEELSYRFATLVDILADVSETTTPRDEKDLLRLYELWLRTKSERAAKALQQAGILPNETVKKDFQ